MKKIGNWKIALVFVVLGLGGAMGGLAIGSWRSVCRDCPSVAQIYAWEPKSATKILSHDGELIAELFQERRTPVQIETLPPYVRHAFIAVEDRRFYHHNGLDYRRIFGAAARNVLSFGITGGASTITQQLARNMFPEEIGFRKRIARKLKEAKVALEIEKVYTKDQILEAYINQIHYGHGWHGIETAAQHYFGKPAAQINPAEAAMLAGVIKLTGRYSPLANPEQALGRRNLVLNLMAQQDYLKEGEAGQWKEQPLPTEPHGGYEARFAPYFVESIRIVLDERFGSDLYRRGYKVYTTLDVGMQRAAQAALDSGFARIERSPSFRHPKYKDVKAAKSAGKGSQTNYLQGVFIALDPQSGAVRAMVGGRDFKDSKFNRATQAMRQPGSVFKPFVFAAALSSGLPASQVIMDEPFSMEQVDGTVWSPKNFDPDFRGPVAYREILKHSLNIPTIKLGLEVGLESVIQQARRMGIETPIPPYPSTSIGAAEVIPLQVAEAYATIATGGVKPNAFSISKVEDAEGRVLFEAKPQRTVVMDSANTAILRDMMRTVVDNGTGYSARDPRLGNLPYEIPAAGKTGTNNDATDIWFAGFTPNLMGVVWFGFDRPKTIVRAAAGGVYAAPVWGQFMRNVYYGEKKLLPKPKPWPLPANVVTRQIDRLSGHLAGPNCPKEYVRGELFVTGTEPSAICELHGPALLGVPMRIY
ncbi:MAG TPA: PBP1A family penicillin-binding protein [Longimicrobiales bacterium]|nr:PBP1A family penicillin-binding protein [Longimicrobiales bacterium]